MRLLYQFNMPQSIPPPLWDFSVESIEFDIRLTLHLVVMWQGRLVHSYGGAEHRIVHPMQTTVVWSIWARVRDLGLGDPYQTVWSPLGGEELTEDAVVHA